MTNWSLDKFCNRWLREQADLPRKSRSTLIYCMLEPEALQSVLETIRQFEAVTNSGVGQVAVMLKQDKKLGTTELFVEGSKGMF